MIKIITTKRLRLLESEIKRLIEENKTLTNNFSKQIQINSQLKKPQIIKYPKCTVSDKTSYNEQTAKKEAGRLSDKFTKMRAYRCEYCPLWHLTHKKDKLKMH